MPRDRKNQPPVPPPTRVVQLVANLGHQFRDPALLVRALTHTSFANESRESDTPHNERLEFLGDAVLELVVRDRLLRAHPDADEGTLSKLRAGIVNGTQLAQVARELGVADALRLGRGEEKSGGREKERTLAGAMEALFGAVYLDGGLDEAASVVGRLLEDALAAAGEGGGRRDFKSQLQELTMKRIQQVPTYRTSEDRGPGREDRFQVEVLVEERVIASNHGRNKKEASQRAAAAALAVLEAEWARPAAGPR